MKTVSAASFALSVTALIAACAAGLYMHGKIASIEERASLSFAPQAPPNADAARLRDLEARILALESAPSAASSRAPAETSVRSGSGSGHPPVDSIESSGVSGGSAGGDQPRHGFAAGQGGAGRPAAETIEAKVKRLESEFEVIRKKIEERAIEEGENPKFEKFAAKLDLTPAQAQASRDIIEKGQSELLDLMKRQLPDGTQMADRLAEAFSSAMDGSEEGKARVGELFKTLITQKVPGSEETYLAAIERHNRDIAGRMDSILNVDQQRKFREWGVKPTDIEIENGPFQRHIIEYIRARQEEGK